MKQEETTRIFYKYRSLEGQSKTYLLDSLKNKYLYFPTPSEVNDPFDCKFMLDFEATDKEILAAIKIGKKRNKNLVLDTVDKFRNAIKDGSIRRMYDKKIDTIISSYHLFSVSRNELNEAMWAHYAQSYTGICLGYQAELSGKTYSFQNCNIKKSKTQSSFDFEKESLVLNKISYDNDGTHKVNIFKLNEDISKESILYSLEHKKINWQYEEEFRCEKIFEEVNKQCFVYYPDTLLKEVLFGYQITSENKAEIIKIIKKNYANFNEIDFFDVIPNLQTYQLEKRKIAVP